jgi:hypothetical protein
MDRSTRSQRVYEYYSESRSSGTSNPIRGYVAVELAGRKFEDIDAAIDRHRSFVQAHFTGSGSSDRPTAYGAVIGQIWDELIPSRYIRSATHYIELGFVDKKTKESTHYYKFPVRLAQPGTNTITGFSYLCSSLDMAINILDESKSIKVSTEFADRCTVICLQALFAKWIAVRGLTDRVRSLATKNP